jgi:hypothetical protein
MQQKRETGDGEKQQKGDTGDERCSRWHRQEKGETGDGRDRKWKRCIEKERVKGDGKEAAKRKRWKMEEL